MTPELKKEIMRVLGKDVQFLKRRIEACATGLANGHHTVGDVKHQTECLKALTITRDSITMLFTKEN